MGGTKIVPHSLKVKRNKTTNFPERPHFLFIFKSYMTLLYLLILDFPKFDPSTATGMALCVNLGPQCQI